jgi:hypothetical protein
MSVLGFRVAGQREPITEEELPGKNTLGRTRWEERCEENTVGRTL